MKFIDVTPTWSALLPGMVAVLQNPKDTTEVRKAQEGIYQELRRMAQAADSWNEHVKKEHSND